MHHGQYLLSITVPPVPCFCNLFFCCAAIIQSEHHVATIAINHNISEIAICHVQPNFLTAERARFKLILHGVPPPLAAEASQITVLHSSRPHLHVAKKQLYFCSHAGTANYAVPRHSSPGCGRH